MISRFLQIVSVKCLLTITFGFLSLCNGKKQVLNSGHSRAIGEVDIIKDDQGESTGSVDERGK